MENKNLKIAHIINELGMGGAEILLTEAMPIYREKSSNVDLCVLLERDNCQFTKEAREINPGKIVVLGHKTFMNPLLVFKIIPLFKKYDVIHVHLFPALYWVAFAKFISFSKIKLVFTEHNTTNKRMENKFFSFIDRIIYKAYSQIITISEDVDLAIKKHLKFDDSKFTLIKNGINLKNINNASAYPKNIFFENADEHTKILIQVSSFKYQKDQETLIKAVSLLPDNVKLIFAGHGETQQKCESLVASLNISDRVKFLGSRKDVPRLLKTADIIVLSSRFEGLSLASVEGLASGKPFIASNVPGLKDVVKGAGLLFEFENAEELAGMVSKLFADKEFYDQTVLKCLERSKEFKIETMVEQQIKLYNTIA